MQTAKDYNNKMMTGYEDKGNATMFTLVCPACGNEGWRKFKKNYICTNCGHVEKGRG